MGRNVPHAGRRAGPLDPTTANKGGGWGLAECPPPPPPPHRCSGPSFGRCTGLGTVACERPVGGAAPHAWPRGPPVCGPYGVPGVGEAAGLARRSAPRRSCPSASPPPTITHLCVVPRRLPPGHWPGEHQHWQLQYSGSFFFGGGDWHGQTTIRPVGANRLLRGPARAPRGNIGEHVQASKAQGSSSKPFQFEPTSHSWAMRLRACGVGKGYASFMSAFLYIIFMCGGSPLGALGPQS